LKIRFLLIICFIILGFLLLSAFKENNKSDQGASFAGKFISPEMEFRPKVRWWWPGGDVEQGELIREVNMLAEQGFGGAEIQPFAIGLDPSLKKDPESPLKSYGTASYYKKLSAVLSKAHEKGLVIDLTMGSGWCAGGSYVSLSDNEKTILSADITVTASQKNRQIPELGPNIFYDAFNPDNNGSMLPDIFRVMKYYPEKAQLVALIAARVVNGTRDKDYANLKDTIVMDISSIQVIPWSDIDVSKKTFSWTHPDDNNPWQIIAVYSMPAGSSPVGTVQTGYAGEESYMVNPHDAAAVNRYYDNWISEIGPILSYTRSGTLRAAFNDSYEFFAQRIYGDEFTDLFKNINGYDITPYLPALLEPGKNQQFSFLVTGSSGGAAPEYLFSDTKVEGINDRINYDYNRVISESFFRNWYKPAISKLSKAGLLFRQQSYNPPLDTIRASGYADISETENNVVPNLKIVSSGSHLYNKPLTSCESMVFYTDEFGGGNFKMTPEIYRRQVDLLMTAGVNEIIYHGFPYRYNDDNGSYGIQNWSPFCSPYGALDISTTLSESDPFWPYIRELNLYASRLQFLMRQGRPGVDVLVYLPLFASAEDKRFNPVLKTLDSNGLTWDWVNEELLQEAIFSDGNILINKNKYKAVIIPDVKSIPVATVNALDSLSKSGARVVIYGTLPSRQPGFNNGNFTSLDAAVAKAARDIASRANSPNINTTQNLSAFINKYINRDFEYDTNENLVLIRRDIDETGTVLFLRNIRQETTEFLLKINPSISNAYALDIKTGDINSIPIISHRIRGKLPAYGSLAVLCTGKPFFETSLLRKMDPLFTHEPEEKILINIRKTDENRYSSDLSLASIDHSKSYVLDLGSLYGVPVVRINGSKPVSIPFTPFRTDISTFLKEGKNRIDIEIIEPLRNRLIRYAQNGVDGDINTKNRYIQFASGKYLPSGLSGPVYLQIVK
jgi:hypothetical protein